MHAVYTRPVFTGLVQDMGTITAHEDVGGPIRLTVAPDEMDCQGLELGESIAHAGICLTVVSHERDTFDVELAAETLALTTAGGWGVGHRVNLERSLHLGDRLGGHLMMGHVDGVGEVRERREADGVLHLQVSLPDDVAPLVCRKGSVAVDGVSLTVNEATRDTFRVTLIPETLKRTTLSALQSGSRVNLEADLIARQLARLVAFGVGVGRDDTREE